MVTAPPRSGTTWIADWLTEHNFPTSHERCFLTLRGDPSIPYFRTCRFPGESSYLAAPWSTKLRAMGVTVIHLRRPIDDIAGSMKHLRWDLSTGWPAVRHFAPEVLETEPFSLTQYRTFARAWTALIDADVVWDLYDVGDKELDWMGERFDRTVKRNN